jgi:hypothetical protein
MAESLQFSDSQMHGSTYVFGKEAASFEVLKEFSFPLQFLSLSLFLFFVNSQN